MIQGVAVGVRAHPHIEHRVTVYRAAVADFAGAAATPRHLELIGALRRDVSRVGSEHGDVRRRREPEFRMN